MVKNYLRACVAFVALWVVGCAPQNTYVPPVGTVAVAFITDNENNERWAEELAYLANSFQNRNYVVLTINVKDRDTLAMAAYIKQLVPYIPEALIFVAPDSYSTTVAKSLDELAGACNTKILCYDRLQFGTNAITGLITSPYGQIGGLQYAAMAALPSGSKVEVLAGPEWDNTSAPLFEGGYAGIEGKVASGEWSIPSGTNTFAQAALGSWSREEAYKRMRSILETYYTDGTAPDAVLAANDAQAAGVADAFTLLYPNPKLPIITGLGNSKESWTRIVYGKQTMTVYPNTLKFANKAIEIVEAWHKKESVVFEESTDNGKKMVPTTIITPVQALYKKDFEQ